MKKIEMESLSTKELVARYAEIGVEQDDVIFDDSNKVFTRLFWEMRAIEDHLKERTGDQRSALLTLYDHRNMQVRLNAAKATLAVAPMAARELLKDIRESRWQPQAMDAGMCLFTLDEGIFKPT